MEPTWNEIQNATAITKEQAAGLDAAERERYLAWKAAAARRSAERDARRSLAQKMRKLRAEQLQERAAMDARHAAERAEQLQERAAMDARHAAARADLELLSLLE